MADIVKISDATALAMHSMIHMAINPEAQSTTADIAKAFKASKHHLAKVHQRLSRAGLIISNRGPTGGVLLARNPSEITLLEIYEVMEGPMANHACLFGQDACPRNDCVLSNLLPELARQVWEYFEQTTLAQLAAASSWEMD
ncbi:MAG: Rrf2 family transcriptional regulator [Verrucomicrobiota bacterium]